MRGSKGGLKLQMKMLGMVKDMGAPLDLLQCQKRTFIT